MATFVVGCGTGANVAPVSGIVNMDGKPLPGGRIMFEPLASGEDKLVGKPAYAEIQPDGSFVLSTFGDGDGAVVGKHHPVVFGNRVEEDPDSPNRGRTGPNIGVIRMEDVTLEVVAGQQNEFTVEVRSKSADVRYAVQDD
jgi:hypothetical protein